MDGIREESLALIEDERAPFDARYKAACTIAEEARFRRTDASDVIRFYEALVRFWKHFGLQTIDRYDEKLFRTRSELARCCWTLSLLLPQGRTFFKYYPRLTRVEGPRGLGKGEILRGALACSYGFSLYEFHWEYPIEGFGVRKDLITVIADDNTRIPVIQWCKDHDLIVFCNRCGLEITCEVSRNCPWSRMKFGGPPRDGRASRT